MNKISTKTTAWMFLTVLFVLGAPPWAVGQQKGNDGVIRLEVTTIEGRVQKPNAFFINTRRSMVYESMEIKESFIEEITRVVETGDF